MSGEVDYDQLDADIFKAFLLEASDLLDGIEIAIVALRDEPGEVARIFRAMHTLKGASKMLGFPAITTLTHWAEEVLDRIRARTLAPSPAVESALLAAVDQVTAMLAALDAREPVLPEDAAVLGALRGLVEPATGPHVPPPVERPRPAAPPVAAPVESPPGAGAEPDGEERRSSSRRIRTQVLERNSLRIDIPKMDELVNRMGEMVIGRIRLESSLRRIGESLVQPGDLEERVRRITEAYDGVLGELTSFGRTTIALQDGVMSLRLVPIDTIFRRFPRVTVETAREVGKRAQLEIVGADVEIDKGICEQLVDPLIHMVRNAISHGIEPPPLRRSRGKDETGTIRLVAQARGEQVLIEVADDGDGIDPARVAARALQKGIVGADELERMDDDQKTLLIFRPGFSTADEVTDASGRGVGMDVVREMIERSRGTITVESRPGEGTTFRLHLPLTLAVVGLLLVRVGEERVAMPIHSVREILLVDREEVVLTGGQTIVSVRGAYIPVIPLGEVLGLPPDAVERSTLPMVVVESVGQSMALVVDALLEKIETVVKPLGVLMAGTAFLSGATILGDGRVVPVLDPGQILREASRTTGRKRAPDLAGASTTGRFRADAVGRRVLVVEDSLVMAKHLASILRGAGYHVDLARDGEEGLRMALAGRYDLVSTDIEMPRMDGYQLAIRLREDPRFADLPIVAVTSKEERVDRVEGFRAGFDEYLTKPVVPATFLITLGRLLARRKSRGVE